VTSRRGRWRRADDEFESARGLASTPGRQTHLDRLAARRSRIGVEPPRRPTWIIDYVLHNGQALRVLDSRTVVSAAPRPWPDVAGNDWPSDHAAVVTTFALYRAE
jgi:membrane-associated phospholipid phosphatase